MIMSLNETKYLWSASTSEITERIGEVLKRQDIKIRVFNSKQE